MKVKELKELLSEFDDSLDVELATISFDYSINKVVKENNHILIDLRQL